MTEKGWGTQDSVELRVTEEGGDTEADATEVGGALEQTTEPAAGGSTAEISGDLEEREQAGRCPEEAAAR